MQVWLSRIVLWHAWLCACRNTSWEARHWTQSACGTLSGGGRGEWEDRRTIQTHLVPQLAFSCISIVSSISIVRAMLAAASIFDKNVELSGDDKVVTST